MASTFVDEVIRRLSSHFGEPEVSGRYKWRVPSPALRPTVSVVIEGSEDHARVTTWVFAPTIAGDYWHREMSKPDEIESLIRVIEAAAGG
jgi:hypothetical protein